MNQGFIEGKNDTYIINEEKNNSYSNNNQKCIFNEEVEENKNEVIKFSNTFDCLNEITISKKITSFIKKEKEILSKQKKIDYYTPKYIHHIYISLKMIKIFEYAKKTKKPRKLHKINE